jgi:hypothetical protein
LVMGGRRWVWHRAPASRDLLLCFKPLDSVVDGGLPPSSQLSLLDI